MLRPRAAILMAVLFVCVSQVSQATGLTAAVFSLMMSRLLVQGHRLLVQDGQQGNPHVKVAVHYIVIHSLITDTAS